MTDFMRQQLHTFIAQSATAGRNGKRAMGQDDDDQAYEQRAAALRRLDDLEDAKTVAPAGVVVICTPPVGSPRRQCSEDFECMDYLRYQEEYDRGEELGRGTSGVVYALRGDLYSGCAIKEMACLAPTTDSDEENYSTESECQDAVVLAANECRITMRLGRASHPHLVAALDAFVVDGPDGPIYALLLSRCTGGTLHDRIKAARHGTTGPLDVERVLRQILTALQYVHAEGYAHCDVKPENLLVESELGAPLHLRLCDYSSARPLHLGDLMFEDPHIDVCTPYYRAPECALSVLMHREDALHAPYLGVGSKIDVWSAACVAVECVTGKPLFREYHNTGLLQAMVDELGPPAAPEWPVAMPYLRAHKLAPPVPGDAATIGAGERVTRARLEWTGARPLWSKLRATMRDGAVDTLRMMLHWDPSGRHSARAALGQLGHDTAGGPILKA